MIMSGIIAVILGFAAYLRNWIVYRRFLIHSLHVVKKMTVSDERGEDMSGKETYEFLEHLVIRRLIGYEKYWARDVISNFDKTKREKIDFLQYEPYHRVRSMSDIEKGVFTVYDIRVSKTNFYSNKSINFIGEQNYFVTTMECCQNIMDDVINGKLEEHIKKTSPLSSTTYGILVPIPVGKTIEEESINPTPLDEAKEWELAINFPCIPAPRQKTLAEMFFYMLRSRK